MKKLYYVLIFNVLLSSYLHCSDSASDSYQSDDSASSDEFCDEPYEKLVKKVISMAKRTNELFDQPLRRDDLLTSYHDLSFQINDQSIHSFDSRYSYYMILLKNDDIINLLCRFPDLKIKFELLIVEFIKNPRSMHGLMNLKDDVKIKVLKLSKAYRDCYTSIDNRIKNERVASL